MRALVVVVAIALALCGCTFGPDYARPKVDAPAAFRYEPSAVTQTANTEWWKQYGDPVLDALIAEALAANWNVQIAAANIMQSTALLTQARSSLFPQVGYGASGTREKFPLGSAQVANGLDTQTVYQALLSVSWEIDLWGRVRRQSEAALANALASQDARDEVILSLVASVATDYIQLRGLDEQLRISKETLGTYDESVKLFELQFKYGQVSQMNVAQAQSQYETAAAQIPSIENQIAQTETALSLLLGRNPGPIARGRTIDQLVLPSVPAGVPSELLEQRPDLRQAEQQLVAANAQIGAAKALYFPTISLTGGYGGVSSDLSKLFQGPARVWSYAGSLTGPIFTFGLVSGQVAQAEAAQQAALLNYRQTVQSAFGDVENALVGTQKLTDQLAAQQRLVDALRTYARLATLQYNAGYVPYSTVLQAEQTLFPSELTLAAVRSQYLASGATMYKATGGGWVALAEAQTNPPPSVQVPEDALKRMPPLF
jgi:multidrug efflux system outer membrane protein